MKSTDCVARGHRQHTYTWGKLGTWIPRGIGEKEINCLLLLTRISTCWKTGHGRIIQHSNLKETITDRFHAQTVVTYKWMNGDEKYIRVCLLCFCGVDSPFRLSQSPSLRVRLVGKSTASWINSGRPNLHQIKKKGKQSTFVLQSVICCARF